MAKKMSNAAPVGKAKDGRTRNWNVIVYPESAPENWRQIIDDLHIEWAESPLPCSSILLWRNKNSKTNQRNLHR